MMNISMQLATIFTKENMQDLLNTVVKWFLAFGKNILIALLVLFIGNKIIKHLVKGIDKALQKTKLEGMIKKFLLSIIKFTIYVLLSIIVISILGIPTTSFVALLSTASLAIGLAVQGGLSNFAGGILILIFKPFKIGDYIKEDSHGNEGKVTGIDLFYTKLLTLDNKIVIVPNGTMANTSMVNFTAEGKRRIELKFGISYSSNIKDAKDALEEVISKDKRLLHDPKPIIIVEELESSQVTIGVKVWTKTDDYWDARWALVENSKLALDNKGVEIPFNQLSVHISDK